MLTQATQSYLAVRRTAGFTLVDTEFILRSFCRHAEAQGETHVVAQSVVAWAARASSPPQRDRRLRTLILFARYARAEDPRHEVPPADVFGRPRRRRPVPFIFSPTDIGRLVEQASRLGPPRSLRPRTYQTLFALLAATGLRISEALKLRLGDLTPDGLIIREAKFRKSRLVPLHDTVTAGLGRYLKHRLRVGTEDDYLFVSSAGRRLTYSPVFRTFRSLVDALGLAPQRSRKPRLHDLRHTFAVRALESCGTHRRHVGQHMLALSTYLGHVGVKHTYWYLQATPLLMTDIAQATERFVKGHTP